MCSCVVVKSHRWRLAQSRHTFKLNNSLLHHCVGNWRSPSWHHHTTSHNLTTSHTSTHVPHPPHHIPHVGLNTSNLCFKHYFNVAPHSDKNHLTASLSPHSVIVLSQRHCPLTASLSPHSVIVPSQRHCPLTASLYPS